MRAIGHGARYGAWAVGHLRRDTRPGKVYFVSRRCTRRHFLFTPDTAGVVARIFFYLLGYAALLTGVQVSAVCVMSSHFHLVIVDRYGRLSDFLFHLDRNLALAIKDFRRWPGEVFDKSQCSAVELVSPEAILDKLAYTIGNGAKSFAVRYAKEWPGALTRLDQLGEHTIEAEHVCRIGAGVPGGRIPRRVHGRSRGSGGSQRRTTRRRSAEDGRTRSSTRWLCPKHCSDRCPSMRYGGGSASA